MEGSVGKKVLETQAYLGREEKQAQIGAEAVTPGAGREAIEVLMESADWIIEGVEAQEGRVVIDGTIACQALYRQGDQQIRAVETNVSVSEAIAFPAVTDKSILYVAPIIEETSARYDNGRILFVISYRLIVSAYALKTVEVIDSVADEASLQTRFEEIRSIKLSAESDADATVAQEVALPKQLDARVALMDWSQAHITESEPDLGGLLVKGEVRTETLIGTGVPARPVAMVKVTMPFEQLVELPQWLTERVEREATVQKLTTRLDQDAEGEAVLRLDAQVRVHVDAEGEDAAEALTDAYATSGERVRTTREDLAYIRDMRDCSCAETFRGTLILPDDAPGVGLVLATRIRAIISDITQQNGHVVVEGWLDVKALYLPSGSEIMHSARGELPFSIGCPGAAPDPARTRIEVVSAEAVALMSDRLDIRCQMQLRGTAPVYDETSIVTEIAQDGEITRPHGIVIVWPSEADDAWSIGKRYCVKTESIPEEVRQGQAILLRM